MQLIDTHRLDHVKQSFATRRVDLAQAATLITGGHAPRSGDVVLVRVDAVGFHNNVELVNGRRAWIYPGDEVLLAYGHRYAPDQFEAIVPQTLAPCAMVAGGGIASQMIAAHATVAAPIAVTPIGVLGDKSGQPLNVADFAVPATAARRRAPRLVVCGTSMNAGKTSAMAALVRGVTGAGLKAGAVKATGTGHGKDLWMFRDSGAVEVLDFTDAGFPSTYKVPVNEIERAADHLVSVLETTACDVILMEIADGLFQAETRDLIMRPSFRANTSGMVFAASDAMGAVHGVHRLATHGHTVLAVSGAMTQSPLARREVASEIAQPVYSLAELATPKIALDLLERARVPVLATEVVA
jgi:hypothetical protein